MPRQGKASHENPNTTLVIIVQPSQGLVDIVERPEESVRVVHGVEITIKPA